MPTQIANLLPGQHGQGPGGDRRTAAMPPTPMPTAAPHARTMTFDPYAPVTPRTRAPMATVMTSPQGQTLPPARRSGGVGRWIGGPALAALVGVLTVWVAGLVNAAGPPAHPHGKLRLSSDPEGATVVVDGKVQTQPTPTVIEGEIGATLRVGFKLDGYLDKEADVFVGDGERPFRAKLDRRDAVVAPPIDPTPEPPPNLAPPIAKEPKDDRTRTKKDTRRERPVVASTNTVSEPPIPAASGSGALSVHVRPWAIVYIDGAKIRQTPLDGHQLGAGLHVVELVNEGIHKKEKVTLDIRANGHEEIRRDWEK